MDWPDKEGTEDDLPDNFFDEFSKSDFLNGLNEAEDGNIDKPRDLEEDLRDLLRSRKEEAARGHREHGDDTYGNRRDQSKTNRDIKKDKEAKVREHIAKQINSASGPPGTELDHYNDECKRRLRKRSPSPMKRRRSPIMHGRSSPMRHRSPPMHRRSPPLYRRSPPLRRRSPRRRSPLPYRSPPTRRRRSRSSSAGRDHQRGHSRSRRSRSRSRTRRSRSTDHQNKYRMDQPSFPLGTAIPFPVQDQFGQPHPPQGYSAIPDGYYPQGGVSGLQPTYYPGQHFSYSAVQNGPVPVTGGYYAQPGIPPPMMGSALLPVSAPPGAVPPSAIPENSLHQIGIAAQQSLDSLDQLLEDGKISKDDYLKLKPKGQSTEKLDLKAKIKVLSRCHDAVTKLAKLHLPNKLIMSNMYKIPELKAITPKFCSPLKRQPIINFNFTSAKTSTHQANKQLVDSIIATIGLQEIVAKPVKKVSNKFKDAECQTTTPFCETCEIRELTKNNNKGTSIDADHFSSSVHTQVIDMELASSKTTFTPLGKASDGGTMSMAHLTPAQLIVSQLAARAKKLEQHPGGEGDDRYMRRSGNTNNSYFGSQMYQNNRY